MRINIEKKNIKIFNYNLTFSDLFFLYKQILSKKSFLRSTHNLFLKKKIDIKQPVANLGSGKKNDYIKYIYKDDILVKNYDFFKLDKNVTKIDLEKKFTLKKKFKSIILFNVLEHIYNKEQLIKSINKNLKKGGKLELFVPFMFRYHGDPKDYHRITHTYLIKFLRENGFKTEVTLIATGQASVILEILLKYLKLSIIKYPFAILLILVNFIFKFFSKDFNNYYCGIHCSCIKIK